MRAKWGTSTLRVSFSFNLLGHWAHTARTRLTHPGE